MIPKKHLGQNFLKDRKILEKIISSADITSEDFVLEIGPGEGILTERISQKANYLLAIEIDTFLCKELEKKFKSKKNVRILSGDIMKINLPQTIKEHVPENQSYKLVANIPYYITSPIIQLLLEQKKQPKEMILMVQKEVAERIAAPKGKMSILAVSVQYYAEAEVLFDVPRSSFYPIPEVDSAVIRITPKRKFEKETEKELFRVVRAGFSAKRKTILNNLSNSFHLEREQTAEIIKKAGLSPTLRAQDLETSDWMTLSEMFKEKLS